MKRYLDATVFFSGMVTLAVELTASRLLGAVFGTSNLVWASIIGLILIYLTAGYFIGGRWADRSPNFETLYRILVWAAFMSGLAPLIARLVLPYAATAFDSLQIGVLAGSFIAVLILFSVPITLLGTVSPFAIRLSIQNPSEAGSVAGRLYALSTLGSFVGTFLPVLVLIPLIGTTLTFLLLSIILFVVAFGGLGRVAGLRHVARFAWMPLVIIAAVLLWGDTPFKRTSGQIYESESAYNYIEVLERGGYRLLRLNEGQGVHSVYHPDVIQYYGPWDLFLVAPFFNAEYNAADVNRIGIVGLAAGTVARQSTAVFGEVPIDGWEIDPEIIEVGETYFGMSLPNLNAIAEDGRRGLMQSQDRYSLIIVDAYRPPYIPWHLTTREFFSLAYDHLEGDGVLAINVGRAPGDRRLIDGLVGTIASLFPNLYVVDVPNSFNSLVIATKQGSTFENLLLNFDRLGRAGTMHPLLMESLATAINNLQPLPISEVVFTDDLAPIEWLTNNLVLNFLLSGGASELQ